MKLRFPAILAIVTVQVTGASALENDIVRHVQYCMKQTRAPGSYAITQANPVPVVTAHTGGSTLGMHNVNDCLLDRYQVQFGSEGDFASATDTSNSSNGGAASYGASATSTNSKICSRGGGPLYAGNEYC